MKANIKAFVTFEIYEGTNVSDTLNTLYLLRLRNMQSFGDWTFSNFRLRENINLYHWTPKPNLNWVYAFGRSEVTCRKLVSSKLLRSLLRLPCGKSTGRIFFQIFTENAHRRMLWSVNSGSFRFISWGFGSGSYCRATFRHYLKFLVGSELSNKRVSLWLTSSTSF